MYSFATIEGVLLVIPETTPGRGGPAVVVFNDANGHAKQLAVPPGLVWQTAAEPPAGISARLVYSHPAPATLGSGTLAEGGANKSLNGQNG